MFGSTWVHVLVIKRWSHRKATCGGMFNLVIVEDSLFHPYWLQKATWCGELLRGVFPYAFRFYPIYRM